MYTIGLESSSSSNCIALFTAATFPTFQFQWHYYNTHCACCYGSYTWHFLDVKLKKWLSKIPTIFLLETKCGRSSAEYLESFDNDG